MTQFLSRKMEAELFSDGSIQLTMPSEKDKVIVVLEEGSANFLCEILLQRKKSRDKLIEDKSILSKLKKLKQTIVTAL